MCINCPCPGRHTTLAEILFNIGSKEVPKLRMDACERAVAYSWEQGFQDDPESQYQHLLWLIRYIKNNNT